MAAKKAKNAVPPDKLALYDRLIATNPAIERKGVALPYTAYNGHMFSFIAESGQVGIRLPLPQRAAFLQQYATTLFEAHGTVMNEYVTVPDSLLLDTEALKPYLELSFAYVQTLKPKPPRKPRAK